jgi:hypothetical protein
MACVLEWRKQASGHNRHQWIISADVDDESMNTPLIREWCAERSVPIYFGDNRSKVEACNADMDKAPADWDVLILVSDDMIPAPNWDATIAEHMPADLRMGLWFPDGRQRKLCTLSVFGRPILDEVLGGFVYHPSFQSVWADNYYQWLMQKHGLLKFVDVQIARHAWQEQNRDALMQRNESRELYRVDRATFQRLTKEQNALAEP